MAIIFYFGMEFFFTFCMFVEYGNSGFEFIGFDD